MMEQLIGWLQNEDVKEWAKLLVPLIIAVITTLWAITRWTGQRKAEREEERKKIAALYVNPFLIACQDLQSRLYNILDNEGLEVLREHYPDGTHAKETLYFIAQYFGWERCIYRYSPYAQDLEVIRLTEVIRDTFAKNTLGLGPFCLFRLEQRNLGELVMDRREGQFGAEFETIPFKAFEQRVKGDVFARRPSVQQILAAFTDAEKVEDLDTKVRERLATVQNYLVDLLKHIEEKEGITFFFSEEYRHRLKAKRPLQREPGFKG
jgi:hypothetical protein